MMIKNKQPILRIGICVTIYIFFFLLFAVTPILADGGLYIVTAKPHLNVRSSMRMSGNIIGKIGFGETVQNDSLGEARMMMVEYDTDKYGYVQKDYLEKVSASHDVSMVDECIDNGQYHNMWKGVDENIILSSLYDLTKDVGMDYDGSIWLDIKKRGLAPYLELEEEGDGDYVVGIGIELYSIEAGISPSTLLIDMARHFHFYKRILKYLLIPNQYWEKRIVELENLLVEYIRELQGGRRPICLINKAMLVKFADMHNIIMNSIYNLIVRNQELNVQIRYEKIPKGGGFRFSYVKIKAIPNTADIHYIYTYNYDLCKIIGKNPEDMNDCAGWYASLRSFERMAGTYYISVKWPDGTKKIERVDIEATEDNEMIVHEIPIEQEGREFLTFYMKKGD